jgi:hypothetical protein
MKTFVVVAILAALSAPNFGCNLLNHRGVTIGLSCGRQLRLVEEGKNCRMPVVFP